MKYCLNDTLSKEYLKRADQIKIKYKDRNMILEYMNQFQDKEYIIDCFNVNDIDWKQMKQFSDLSNQNVVLCLDNINLLRQCLTSGIKGYLGYPISTFWERNAVKFLGVEYVRLDTSLFFEMDNVKKAGIKVRAVPNIAYNDPYPHQDGVVGTWIRPEDVETIYGEYIDVIEFEDCDKDKESALYRIYAEDKKWDEDLSFIITNLDYHTLNRLIESRVSTARLNCGHKCQKTGVCNICYRVLTLASPDSVKAFQEKYKALQD